MYQIEPATRHAAARIGVIVRPSQNANKKIDVYDKQNNKLVSIGAAGMMDYHKYLKRDGLQIANERRRLYKQRHEKDRHARGTPGYYADKLLW